MSTWPNLEHGRAKRQPKPPREDLRVKTPSQVVLPAKERQARRRARIAQLEAETALCAWCGMPAWRDVHAGCADALAQVAHAEPEELTREGR